jgi:hypothetical protein
VTKCSPKKVTIKKFFFVITFLGAFCHYGCLNVISIKFLIFIILKNFTSVRRTILKILGHKNQFAGKTAHVIRKSFYKIVLDFIFTSKSAWNLVLKKKGKICWCLLFIHILPVFFFSLPFQYRYMYIFSYLTSYFLNLSSFFLILYDCPQYYHSHNFPPDCMSWSSPSPGLKRVGRGG